MFLLGELSPSVLLSFRAFLWAYTSAFGLSSLCASVLVGYDCNSADTDGFGLGLPLGLVMYAPCPDAALLAEEAPGPAHGQTERQIRKRRAVCCKDHESPSCWNGPQHFRDTKVRNANSTRGEALQHPLTDGCRTRRPLLRVARWRSKHFSLGRTKPRKRILPTKSLAFLSRRLYRDGGEERGNSHCKALVIAARRLSGALSAQ